MGKQAQSCDAQYLHGTPPRGSDGHCMKVARIALGGLHACHWATGLVRCRDGHAATEAVVAAIPLQVTGNAGYVIRTSGVVGGWRA